MRWVLDRICGSFQRARRDSAIGPATGESLRYQLLDEAEDTKPRCLISFLGELPQNIAEIVDTVVVACRDRGEFPVVVMSELRPDLIAANSAPIEFIPTRYYLPLLTISDQRRRT